MSFFSTRHFRTLGFVEASSFLLLLFVAMPLKYWAGFPAAVSVVGALHGLIFVLYLGFLALVAGQQKWPWLRVGGAVLAAILPFGPFVFDRLALKKANASTPK